MNDFKLVVISPFDNYKRGDQIINQDAVKKIIDDGFYAHHCRKVYLRACEKPLAIASAEGETVLNIESIKDTVVPNDDKVAKVKKKV